MNPKTIDRFRKGKPGVIRKDLIPELFKAIGINEGSALGDVMNLKLENPNAEISQEILQQVVEEGQVVFYEHLPNDADYILSKPEKDIYKAVEKESTVGDRLRVLREALGIEKPDYRVTGESYGNFEIAEATINAIERGRNVPETHTAARIIKQYTGWSPFYPIARLILDAARSHRFE